MTNYAPLTRPFPDWGWAPIFCTLKGERMATAYIRALMPRLACKARSEKRVHARAMGVPGQV